MIAWLKGKYTTACIAYPVSAKIGRYVISGGTAAAVNLVLLYILTEYAGMWYLLSAVCSFIIAFGVSFILQKSWTFQDASKDGIHRQLLAYLLVALINLGLNTALLYSFVEYAKLHYLLSQIMAGIIVAAESFFVYQIFIFKKPQIQAEVEAE